MKKRLLFFLISMLLINNVSTQSFGTNNSEWVYDYLGGIGFGITKISYKKDTIIEDRQVKIFTKKAYRLKMNGDSVSGSFKPIYIHSKHGIVEYSQDEINFDTLYNYNAKIGQSWIIYRRDFGELDSIKVTILDTFRTLINNQYLFTQKIKWTYQWGSRPKTFTDTVYEYIGARWTYIFPFDRKDVARDGGEGGLVRCFRNDVLGVVDFYSIYQSPYEYDCDNLTSTISPDEMDKAYTIYPNPVLNALYVESEHPDRSELKIVDITGRVIHSADILPGTNTMDVSGMPSGYYMVIVNGKMVGKVVK